MIKSQVVTLSSEFSVSLKRDLTQLQTVAGDFICTLIHPMDAITDIERVNKIPGVTYIHTLRTKRLSEYALLINGEKVSFLHGRWNFIKRSHWIVVNYGGVAYRYRPLWLSLTRSAVFSNRGKIAIFQNERGVVSAELPKSQRDPLDSLAACLGVLFAASFGCSAEGVFSKALVILDWY